jgi:OOP family OmpA-OmpF porin
LTELKTKRTDRGLVITLGDVLFEFNQSDLVPGAARNLDPLVTALQENPEQNIEIEGHTDNIGSESYNIDLSKRRAESVKDYLLKHDIAAERVSTEGLGFAYPVASNNTEAGRQQNRRVEIILPQ